MRTDPIARRGVGLMLALATLGHLGTARADAGLAELRLFVSPERRAALDGDAATDASPAPPAPRTPPDVEGRPGADVARPAARAAAGRIDRPGAPPAGSATLRSSRGTSRIVDGVPVRDGPVVTGGRS